MSASVSESVNESLPAGLCHRTLDSVVTGAGLTEVPGADGGPYAVLRSAMGPDPVGEVRVFSGTGQVVKAVYVGLVVPMIGLDSHMVFAFTAGDSVVPHFTLDSVQGQGSFAFHLDLIPRAELGTHLTYLDWSHDPLSEVFEEVRERPGLTRAAIGPRQCAVMSPWMLAQRADEQAFAGIEDAVEAYLAHWFALVGSEVPAQVLADVADTDLAARDLRNRSILFHPGVDKVWAQVARLVGDETAEQIRGLLLDNTIVTQEGAA